MRVGGLGALCAVVALSTAFSAPVAAADGAAPEVVVDGRVVTLPYDEAVPSGVRRLPELAGLAFVAPLEGGTAATFSTSQGSFGAAAGDVLVFVAADVQVFAPPLGLTGFHYSPPLLTLSVGGRSLVLPQSPSDTVDGVAGSAYGDSGAVYGGRWVVAVPAGSDPVVTAAEAGLSQAVDVRTGQRVGPAPEVLYRDPAGPLGLDVRPGLAGQLAVSVGGSPASLPVTLEEAVLSYFRLDEQGAPAGLPVDEAYLLVRVAVDAGVDGVVLAGAGLRSLVGVRVAGTSAPLAARFVPSLSDEGYPLDGVFVFVVPASATGATVTVGEGGTTFVAVQNPAAFAPTVESAPVTAAATFPVAFPPPSVPPPSLPARSVPAPSARSQGASPASGATPAGSSASGARSVPATVGRSSARSPAASHVGVSGTALAVGTGAGGAGLVVVVLGVVVWRRKTVLVAATPVSRDGGDTVAVQPAPLGDTPSCGGAQGAPADRVSGELPGGCGASTADVERPSVAHSAGVGAAAADEHVELPGLVVRVLGPLVVEGLTAPIRRRAGLRALIVLAVHHPRPVTSEQLRGLLASDEVSEPSATTLRSELSRLRSVLPSGMLPDRAAGSGYVLAAAVAVDWGAFRALAARARSSTDADPIAAGLEALRLVRGRVLEHASWHGIDRTIWDIEAAVDGLAVETAGRALRAGRAGDAAEAARCGLLGVPESPELWRLRIAAADAGSGESPRALAVRARAEGVDLPGTAA